MCIVGTLELNWRICNLLMSYKYSGSFAYKFLHKIDNIILSKILINIEFERKFYLRQFYQI